MKTLEYFARLEGDTLRSDPSEGADYARQVKSIEIADEHGVFVPITGIINPIFQRRSGSSGVNIFCMHALRFPSGHPIDPRNFAFGLSCIVLTNGEEFLSRVRRAPLPTGRRIDWSLIKYVNRTTYDGPLAPFLKFDTFSYQKEFRLAVSGGDVHDFDLEIGDIRDICVVVPADEINQRLRANPSGDGFEIGH